MVIDSERSKLLNSPAVMCLTEDHWLCRLRSCQCRKCPETRGNCQCSALCKLQELWWPRQMGGEDRKMFRMGERTCSSKNDPLPIFYLKNVFLYFFKVLPLILCLFNFSSLKKTTSVHTGFGNSDSIQLLTGTHFYMLSNCRRAGAEVYQGPCPSLGEEVQGKPPSRHALSSQSREVMWSQPVCIWWHGPGGKQIDFFSFLWYIFALLAVDPRAMQTLEKHCTIELWLWL